MSNFARVSLLLVAMVVVMMAVPVFSAYCSGTPKTLNGKPCASTTRYYDGQMGACGCGTNATAPFSWQWTTYTAAGSPKLFGVGSTWCGSGCGKCYKITPTGYTPTGGNACGSNCATSITVMITNLCPESGNYAWCRDSTNNNYGYAAHFDLMDLNMNGKIKALGWDNPEVTYESVSCGSGGSPTTTQYGPCQC